MAIAIVHRPAYKYALGRCTWPTPEVACEIAIKMMDAAGGLVAARAGVTVPLSSKKHGRPLPFPSRP